VHHSTHSKFDDSRYWRFERSSGLPFGYFDRPRFRVTMDMVIVAVCVVGLAIGLLVCQP
jgi:hypothetical protein